MTIKRRSGSTFVDILNIRRRSGSSWVVPSNVYRRSGGSWVKVWPVIQPLRASIPGDSEFYVPNGAQSIVLSASVSGGVPGYTYSWGFAPGKIGMQVEGGTTGSYISLRSNGTNRSTDGLLSLLVTDSTGATSYAEKYITVYHGILA